MVGHRPWGFYVAFSRESSESAFATAPCTFCDVLGRMCCSSHGPVVSCGILWLLGYFGFLIIEVLTIGGPSRYSPLWGRCGLDIPPLDVEIFQIWQPCSGHSAGQHCFSVLQCTSSTASNRSTVWCTPTPSGRALRLDLGLKSCSSHTGAPFELRWT